MFTNPFKFRDLLRKCDENPDKRTLFISHAGLKSTAELIDLAEEEARKFGLQIDRESVRLQIEAEKAAAAAAAAQAEAKSLRARQHDLSVQIESEQQLLSQLTERLAAHPARVLECRRLLVSTLITPSNHSPAEYGHYLYAVTCAEVEASALRSAVEGLELRIKEHQEELLSIK